MTRKTLYLHAGIHKTGSTSLQGAMNLSREVLNEAGVHYLHAGTVNGAHQALAPFDRHTWWAVGEKTADFLHNEFGVRARYPVDQCFEGLEIEFEHADLPARVVAFTLEGKPRDLSPVLAERGIDYYQIPVYRTQPAEYSDLETFLDHYRGTFSPEAQQRERGKVEWL